MVSARNASRGRDAVRYRRSLHLVAYWSDRELIFENYATGSRCIGTALTIGLLDYFSDWRPVASLADDTPFSRNAVRRAVADLVRHALLQRSDREPEPKDKALGAWRTWNPAAGMFHTATRDLDFASGEQQADQFLRDRLSTRPQPAKTKHYRGRPQIALPQPARDGEFAKVLLDRRTWRRFGPRPLTLDALATLLGLTFGVQQWVDQGELGRAMLRTSPSGGARHPLEAYVVVRDVQGLRAGLYHYAPDDHRLTLLHRGGGADRIKRYLPGQPFYVAASALVVMTAVFSRTEWQYPFPRAYRVVHLEAGHFCQTFCLVATSLKLAPFCTAALSDSLIERDLGIDGVTESVIYACGVGTRPPGVDWAPWPDTTNVPRVFPPKSASRRKRAG